MDRMVFDAYKKRDIILKSLDIVRQFIIDKNLLLTGGMAIDMALKSVGNEGIYTEDELPDYDFFSPQFHVHAYELGQKLCQAGMPGITVINALHIMTMKIRTDFDVVGDLTFMNPSIFEKMPYLEITSNDKKPIRVIHPHFMMATQFLSLARSFDNYPREIIFHRGKKDIIRCNMLDENFPLPIGKKPTMKTIQFDINDLGSVCLSGWTALSYWLGECKSTGVPEIKLEVNIPKDRDIEMLSEHIDDLISPEESSAESTSKKYKIVRWMAGYLDIIPRSIVIQESEKPKIRVFDSFGYKIGAHYDPELKVHVCNLQYVLCQLMCEYLDTIDTPSNEYIRYGYHQARDLVIGATADPKAQKLLLPTVKTYGVHNLSSNFFIGAVRFLHEADISNIDISKFQLPSMHAFDQCVVPERLLEYDVQTCEFFRSNYRDTEPFEPLQVILRRV